MWLPPLRNRSPTNESVTSPVVALLIQVARIATVQQISSASRDKFFLNAVRNHRKVMIEGNMMLGGDYHIRLV